MHATESKIIPAEANEAARDFKFTVFGTQTFEFETQRLRCHAG